MLTSGVYRRLVWRVGRRLPPTETPSCSLPDWQQARPEWIQGALQRALSRSAGGWYAVDAARAIRRAPQSYTIAGRELVLWRCGGRLYAAPGACPHLGAPLCEGSLRGERLICPWHGLALGQERHGPWMPLPAFDDGVLAWVQLANGEEPSAHPKLPPRPTAALDAVFRVEAACAPRDVLANRLDPWHGVHFHPHSFGRLRVIEQSEEDITVRVAYRALWPVCVEVDARFFCPDRRTIVMTIVRGEGEGSVVETHATPLTEGRTAIVEAILATSTRRGFWVARALAGFLRPWIRRAARRLWEDDTRYAERLYRLRAER